VLRAGEWVRLVDGKGRRHNFELVPGKRFFSNRGHLEHDDLIGREEGFTVASSAGGEYLVFRPLLSEFVVSMPRGAAVVYPKDAAQIVATADIFPGAQVVEAGVGSGWRSPCHLASPFFRGESPGDAPTRQIYPQKNAGSWRRLAEGGGT
jgi:tRNA (adenine57-N1/adenine58-N1)-methyltransferase